MGIQFAHSLLAMFETFNNLIDAWELALGHIATNNHLRLPFLIAAFSIEFCENSFPNNAFVLVSVFDRTRYPSLLDW